MRHASTLPVALLFIVLGCSDASTATDADRLLGNYVLTAVDQLPVPVKLLGSCGTIDHTTPPCDSTLVLSTHLYLFRGSGGRYLAMYDEEQAVYASGATAPQTLTRHMSGSSDAVPTGGVELTLYHGAGAPSVGHAVRTAAGLDFTPKQDPEFLIGTYHFRRE